MNKKIEIAKRVVLAKPRKVKRSFQEFVEEKYGINREVQIENRLSEMPVTCKNTYKKATAHKSMRSAVNSMCCECVGYQRREVSICTDLGCPLYSYRPYQKRTKHNNLSSDF